MRIEISLGSIAGFLVSLAVATTLWAWLDPGPNIFHIVLPVIGGELLLMLGVLMRRPQAVERDGWRYLRPGFVPWLSFVGLGLAAVFFGLVFVSLDWSRIGDPPGRWLLLAMILFFAALALVCAMMIWARIFRWNDEVIQERTALLQVRQLAWDEIVNAETALVGRQMCLRGRDGTAVRASLDDHGIDRLLADFRARFPGL